MNTSVKPPSMMVAHLSDLPSGGAAVAADRLVQGLLEIGFSAERWILSNQFTENIQFPRTALESGTKRPLTERLIKNFSKRTAARMRSIRHLGLLLAKIEACQPSILHLHNLHASGITHNELLAIPMEIPIVWTLHDAWPMAPWAYRWNDGRGLPVTEGAEADGIQNSLLRRMRFFETRKNLVLTSPSHWLAGIAEEYTPEGTRIEVIPYGMPSSQFKCIPKKEACIHLGLDADLAWIGFAASNIDSRKGGDVFRDALSLCADHNDLGVLIWGDDSQWKPPQNIRAHRFGFISEAARLSLLYSACSIFVCPSRIDNLPNTILESMACGTPVIGSKIGGIPDMVRPGETGWLFDRNSPQDCAKTILNALNEKETLLLYSKNCRAILLHEYGLQLQATRYLKLYKNLL